MSGHAKDEDAKNPKEHHEHPGPEAPASKGTAQSSSSESQSSGSQNSSSGAKPAIHQPGQPDQSKDAEVEAHNKEMEQRSDRTANQLKESDNKVDKKFWSGERG